MRARGRRPSLRGQYGPVHMLFYGVVNAQTEKLVEFFLEREAAEVMIRVVREDEPIWKEIKENGRPAARCGRCCWVRSDAYSVES